MQRRGEGGYKEAENVEKGANAFVVVSCVALWTLLAIAHKGVLDDSLVDVHE